MLTRKFIILRWKQYLLQKLIELYRWSQKGKTKRKWHVNFFELETEVLLYCSIWLFSWCWIVVIYFGDTVCSIYCGWNIHGVLLAVSLQLWRQNYQNIFQKKFVQVFCLTKWLWSVHYWRVFPPAWAYCGI